MATNEGDPQVDLAEVADAHGGGMVVADVDGRLTWQSPGAERLLGIEVGSDLAAWCARSHLRRPGTDAPLRLDDLLFVSALRGDPKGEREYVWDPPGARAAAYLRVAAIPMRGPGGDVTGAAIVLRDVTDQRVTEQRLELEERFFADVIDCIADPIFVKDRAYRFALVNRALCAMVGFSREELVGRTDYDFLPKEQSDFFRLKDEQMFVTGSHVSIEEEPITDATGAEHVLSTIKAPLHDDRGEVSHLVGIIHDITQAKRAAEALERANQALAERVAEREAALAQLAAVNHELEAFSYSVSHDLRQPLRAIDGFSKALIEDYGPTLPAEARGYLERVRAGTGRMGDLIDDLLALSRLSQIEVVRTRVDLSALTREVMAALQAGSPTREVDAFVDEGLEVEADPKLVRIVLENLLGNAWKFTGHKARADRAAAVHAGGRGACDVRGARRWRWLRHGLRR